MKQRTSRTRRTILVAGPLVAAMSVTTPTAALAQEWPSRPIRFVVPFSSGGTVDLIARVMAPGLQDALGQTVIVENRPGAGGTLAAEYVARSEPDGYTFFFTSNGPLLYAPITFGKSYQWDKDFVPVSSVSFTPMVLQANPELPVRSLPELLALIAKQPDKFNMSTAGAGTLHHLISELLQARTGVRWATVHYKGSAPAIQDMLGGRIQFGFDPLPVSLPYVKDGRLRALAVTTSRRVPALPNVPTLIELGIADFTSEAFGGILAPRGTPRPILDRLHAELAKVVAKPAVVERFERLGAEARALSPSEFAAYLRAQYDTWVPVVRKINLQAN